MHKLLIKLIVSGFLVAFLLSRVDPGEIGTRIASIDLPLVAVAASLLAFVVMPSAIRWWLVLREMKSRLPFRLVGAIVWIGMFFNQVLPSTVGGDAVRIWRAHRAGLPGWSAIESVVVDRVSGLTALVLIVVVGSPFLLQTVWEPELMTVVSTVIVLSVAGIASLLLLIRIPRLFPQWAAASMLARLLKTLHTTVFAGRAAVLILICGLLVHLSVALAAFALAVGLDMTVSLSECLMAVPVAMLAAAIPISVAGWGVREGSIVLILGHFGVAWVDAVTLSITLGLTMALVGLPGGIIWVITDGASLPGQADSPRLKESFSVRLSGSSANEAEAVSHAESSRSQEV